MPRQWMLALGLDATGAPLDRAAAEGGAGRGSVGGRGGAPRAWADAPVKVRHRRHPRRLPPHPPSAPSASAGPAGPPPLPRPAYRAPGASPRPRAGLPLPSPPAPLQLAPPAPAAPVGPVESATLQDEDSEDEAPFLPSKERQEAASPGRQSPSSKGAASSNGEELFDEEDEEERRRARRRREKEERMRRLAEEQAREEAERRAREEAAERLRREREMQDPIPGVLRRLHPSLTHDSFRKCCTQTEFLTRTVGVCPACYVAHSGSQLDTMHREVRLEQNAAVHQFVEDIRERVRRAGHPEPAGEKGPAKRRERALSILHTAGPCAPSSPPRPAPAPPSAPPQGGLARGAQVAHYKELDESVFDEEREARSRRAARRLSDAAKPPRPAPLAPTREDGAAVDVPPPLQLRLPALIPFETRKSVDCWRPSRSVPSVRASAPSPAPPQ
eukprot:tig00001128_g7179.t1